MLAVIAPIASTWGMTSRISDVVDIVIVIPDSTSRT